jgi:hypothetical protein
MSTLPLSMVLTRAAISRITGVLPRYITSFELEFDDLICVRIKPTRANPQPKPIILNLMQMETEFHRFRQEGGRSLVCMSSRTTGRGTIIHHVEGQGADVYLVEESDTHLACECEDWHQHTTLCKHGWSVLQKFNCRSLLELWQLRKQATKPEPAIQFSRPAPKLFGGVPID